MKPIVAVAGTTVEVSVRHQSEQQILSYQRPAPV